MLSPLKLFKIGLEWKFANTFLLVLSLVVFFFLAETPAVQAFLASTPAWGLPGAFITGVFFVSTFTVAPATVVLFSLAHSGNPFAMALAASAGAVAGDYIIFRFMRDRLVDEWVPLFHQLAESPFGKLFSSPFFAWLAPVVGALIIASPLPDEIGVSLLGAVRLKSWKMISLTFVLNTIGIFAIVLFAHSLA